MSVNGRVLIVEDDPAIREMVAEYLGGQGYEVHQAEQRQRHARGDRAQSARRRAARRAPARRRRPHARALPARALRRRDHHGDRRGRTWSIAWSGSKSAPTTTSPSRSIRASSSRALKSVMRRLQSRPPPTPPTARVGPERVRGRPLLPRRRLASARSTSQGQEVPITSMEFDLLKVFTEHPEQGAHARPDPDAHAQSRLGAFRPLDRHPHRAPAPQGRTESRRAAGDPHDARRGLHVRAAHG